MEAVVELLVLLHAAPGGTPDQRRGAEGTMIHLNCPKCGDSLVLPDRPAGDVTQCPRCQEPVPVSGSALIDLVCPGCHVKLGASARLAGTFTRCGQCGLRVMVPRAGEALSQPAATGPSPLPASGWPDDEPPPRQVSPEEREQRSTWAWTGMFLGGLLPAGLLFVCGVALDWHHQPDLSSVFLASLLLTGAIGAAAGYLLGALAYVLRGERRWFPDGAQKGSWWGALLLGTVATVAGGVAGGVVGVAILQQAVVESWRAPGGTGPGRAFLLAAASTVFTALIAGLVCTVVGALLGRILGGRGGYD
jgi:Zn-finger nucleic acid-binding protein